MVIRFLAAMLLASNAGIAFSYEVPDGPTVAVGDTVVLDLVDAPAIAFLKARSVSVPEGVVDIPGAVGVSLESRVTAVSEEKVEVQYLTSIEHSTGGPKVFTVTVTARLSDLKKPSGVVTARTATNSVPAAVRRMEIRHSRLPSLRIGTLDAVKLQFWVPEQE